MKILLTLPAILATIVVSLSVSQDAELEQVNMEGLEKIQLVTDVSAVVPGKSFQVGLILDPKPGFHTYWRGPGVVGVATSLQWELPEGFTAGPLLWSPPTKVDMVGITANGYKSEVCLLTEIHCPEEISTGEITVKAHAAWMACASSCHPGVTDFEMTLPVKRSDHPVVDDETLAARFRAIRDSQPPPTPEGWSVTPILAASDTILLEFSVPGFSPSKPVFEFFCDDMQVDSDKEMHFEWIDRDSGQFRLRFSRPDFAPKNPPIFSGLLFSQAALPETESHWVEISAPWPEGTFSDE